MEFIPLTDDIPDSCDVREQIDHRFLCQRLDELLDTLCDREKKVLIHREYMGMTLKAVGKLFNVQQERIRQIQSKAIRKLRHPSRMERLLEFVPDIVERHKRRQREQEEKQRLKEERLLERARWRRPCIDLINEINNKVWEERLWIIDEESRLAEIKSERRWREEGPSFRLWLANRTTEIRSMFDSSPKRLFAGGCSCKWWEAEYSLPIDSFEIGCANCMEKFTMEFCE